jgi:hypothetical protein
MLGWQRKKRQRKKTAVADGHADGHGFGSSPLDVQFNKHAECVKEACDTNIRITVLY